MKNEEIIIGMYLGTIYSCTAIYRDNYVDEIAETQSRKRSQPSIVYFKNNN